MLYPNNKTNYLSPNYKKKPATDDIVKQTIYLTLIIYLISTLDGYYQ